MESGEDIIPDSQETDSEVEVLNYMMYNKDKKSALSAGQPPYELDVNVNLRLDHRARELAIADNIDSDTMVIEQKEQIEDTVPNTVNNSNSTIEDFDRGSSTPKRILRKRTAIQKMPYSLERIKHRQLLEGYNVASFDIISNKVDISALEARNRESATMPPEDRIINNEMDDLYIDTIDISSDESSNLHFGPEEGNMAHIYPVEDSEYIGESPNNHRNLLYENSTTHSNNSDDNDAVDIRFRGRKLNIKSGFRGVLPRMVWEKQLSISPSKKVIPKRKIISLDGKGVAKKKKNQNINSKQDTFLLNELITDDNQVDDNQDFEMYHQESNKKIGPDFNLTDADDYYHMKYDNSYLSDSSLEDLVQTDLISINKSTNCTVQNNRRNILVRDFPIESLNDVDNEVEYPSSDENILLEAFEENKSTFIPMLSAGNKERRKKTARPKSQMRSIPRSVSDKYKDKKSVYKGIKSRSINTYKGSHRIHNKSDPIIERNLNKNISGSFINRRGQKDGKKRKTYRYKSNRDLMTYNTVVEALSKNHKTASKKLSNHNGVTLPTSVPDLTPSINPEVTSQIERTPRPDLLSLPILDVLFKKLDFVAPSSVTLSLNNETYTLSKLDRNRIDETLKTVFNSIIKIGATDNELIAFAGIMSEFLWQLDTPSIQQRIEEFHAKFSEKLHLLKQRAKPIHFYMLAICQLFLLEISQFSNVAFARKIRVQTKILNNIVSFFNLHSICHDQITSFDGGILYQSYDILATIVDTLDQKEKLWDKLTRKKFIPEIVQLLCNIFPTKEPKWDIIYISNDFSGVQKCLAVVHFCYFKLNWNIENSIILRLHAVFKGRRFSNFDEEHTLSTKGKVRTNISDIYDCKTIFNGYLLLLMHMEISKTLLEKLTPIGKIKTNDSTFTVINRLNLLMLLAQKSTLDYERLFSLIVSQLVELRYFSNLDKQDLNRICESMLNTIIFFLSNNSKKHLKINCKMIPVVYSEIVSQSPLKSTIWFVFLQDVNKVILKYKETWSRLYRPLYKCFINPDIQINDTNVSDYFLDLYMVNLKSTDPSWLQSNLFQILKEKAQSSINYVDRYCILGNFLILNDKFNWWSFITYNNLQRNKDIQFYFYCNVLELCNDSSFKLIEKDLFEILVRNIEQENRRVYFMQFCKFLVQKTENITVSFDPKNTEIINYPSFWRRLFKILTNSKYYEVFYSLVQKLIDMYISGIITGDCMKPVIIFLDSKFLHLLQSIPRFNDLRHQFGISNQEIENNKFRNTLTTLHDSEKQTLFIETEILSADFNQTIREKLISMLSSESNIIINPYKLVTRLIILNTQFGKKNDEIYKEKIKISSFLLDILMQVNLSNFYQITAAEYKELFSLLDFIIKFCNDHVMKENEMADLSKYVERCIQFTLQLSSIGTASDENSTIKGYFLCNTQNNSVGNSNWDDNNVLSNKLIEQINRLVNEKITKKSFPNLGVSVGNFEGSKNPNPPSNVHCTDRGSNHDDMYQNQEHSLHGNREHDSLKDTLITIL